MRPVFYSNDRQLLDRVSQFIGAALNAGNGAVVVATGAHREGLMQSLQASGVDMAAALEQDRYIAVDPAELLSACMVNGMLEPNPFLQGFGQLILQAASAANAEHPRVAVFGEGPDLLWKQGNIKAAIQDEKLGNQLAETYRCGHFMRLFAEQRSGCGGRRHLATNLCRAFSRLLSVKSMFPLWAKPSSLY